MFKRSTRVTAGILSAAVVASLVVFPQLSHAQATTDSTSALASTNQYQMIQEVQRYNETHRDAIAKAEKLAQTSVSAQDVSTAPVEYKGSVSGSGVNIYHFTVAADSTVIVIGVGSNTSIYSIWNVDTGKQYYDRDVLPAGNYQFVVYVGRGDLNYDIYLSGVSFAGVPDNTLPTYNITSPTQKSMLLPPGAQTLTFTGTTDATQADLSIYSTSGDTVLQSMVLDPNFSVDVPIVAGDNYVGLNFFKDDGNGVITYYEPTVKSVTRLAGTDRFQGSALVSQQIPFMFDGEGARLDNTVIIANGISFPDGLSGGSLAGFNNAPILLTKASGLSVDVVNEIKRRGDYKAIILGGTGVVSTNVETQLKAAGITQITRLAGADRYATSAAIATELSKEIAATHYLPAVDTAIIVSGQNFPDALSASSPSAIHRIPILSVKSTGIPAPIQQYITSHNIKKFVIVGGSGVVSTTVEGQLVKIAGSASNVKRLYGQNRYQTSVEVAKYFFANPWQPWNPGSAVVASGVNFPDALAGGPFAASIDAPILLTSPTALPAEVSDYLVNTNDHWSIDILGGTGAVSTNVEQQLSCWYEWE